MERPQTSLFNPGNFKPPYLSPQIYMLTHTYGTDNTHGTDKATVSHMQQAQNRQVRADARTRLPAPNGEADSEAGTWTPADGIQVPQGPATAHGPGQRPVPP